ncbi:MAG TPA: segregation/condensation protein A [Alphaproteobacteria bacterium]|nr:segregation/condensation protein A [Alphaproteobacteria bacterium]
MSKKLVKVNTPEREKQLEQIKNTSERIFNMLFVEDELSWKDMIYALIEEEHMNPWDIDVSLLSQKFLSMLRKLKELDFRISGKMVLASAILLKMKSDILKDEDIANFDNVINGIEENMPIDEDPQTSLLEYGERPQLFPRTPQPRQRKVSVFDLVQALEKALEVENRRNKPKPNTKKLVIKMPEKHFDLGKSMDAMYGKVQTHYGDKKNKDKILTFDELTQGSSKHDKVLTFVPLLHLDNLRKVDLEQNKHFDQIKVKVAGPRDTKVEEDVKTAE